jgi:hypothetical protein
VEASYELLGPVADGGGAESCGWWQSSDGEGAAEASIELVGVVEDGDEGLAEASIELERVASGKLLGIVADGGEQKLITGGAPARGWHPSADRGRLWVVACGIRI